jgi:hypothetical protein
MFIIGISLEKYVDKICKKWYYTIKLIIVIMIVIFFIDTLINITTRFVIDFRSSKYINNGW